MDSIPRHSRKLVIVGDSAVGKTSLLTRFARGEFPQAYIPVVFENFVVDVEADGRPVELSLWDTAGQTDYDRLRPLSYLDTHIVLMCFSLVDPNSLDNVQEKWFPEIRHFLPVVPIILVGCKKDLRNDQRTLDDLARLHQRPVSSNEGMVIAIKNGAHHYLECSSKLGEGVDEIFMAATRLALICPTTKKKGRRAEFRDGRCVVS
ncbi:P-loop containing nucleoside triphosphate hydrolase protein [Flagelloscypha sp. PMI_526]|nr:P-loop containing nucleoside triphosphate hydrolase protein [Flagelloscypha sp. PMI_526]